MKKLLLIIGLALGSVSVSNAMKGAVTLADAKTLSAQLDEMGLNHFNEETHIAEQLGGQKRAPLGVIMAVELALSDYNQNFRDPVMELMMLMQKPAIIEALLVGNDAAIAQAKAYLAEIDSRQ